MVQLLVLRDYCQQDHDWNTMHVNSFSKYQKDLVSALKLDIYICNAVIPEQLKMLYTELHADVNIYVHICVQIHSIWYE